MMRLAERLTPATDHALPAYPRRIYILPTGAGLAFGLTVVTLGAAATNHANNLALALACLLAGLGIATAVATHLALARLRLEAITISPVFCGEAAPCQLQIHSPASTRIALEIQAYAGPWTPCPLSPGTNTVHTPWPTTRRGPVTTLELGLATGHPLGLFRAWTRVRLRVTGIVYPRPWPECRLFPSGSEGADAARQGPPPGEDPHDLRPYRPGDPPRRIAWKAAAKSRARGGPLVVRELDDPAGEALLFRWEHCPEEGEARISHLTACVLQAEATGRRYGLALPGLLLLPDHGPAHRHRCLEALACLPEDQTVALATEQSQQKKKTPSG